jgi:hypothetical protein
LKNYLRCRYGVENWLWRQPETSKPARHLAAGFLYGTQTADTKTPLSERRVCYFLFKYGAGNETRTRDPDLGKVVLYQLSYSRDTAWY